MTTLNSLKLKVHVQMSEIQEPENTFLSHRKSNLIEPVHEILVPTHCSCTTALNLLLAYTKYRPKIRLAPVLKTFFFQYVISYTCSYSLILMALKHLTRRGKSLLIKEKESV